MLFIFIFIFIYPLHHRFPFLLVDRVIEYNPGVSAVAIKNVTINDNFFPGHFPERPIMPGVLMIEVLPFGSSTNYKFAFSLFEFGKFKQFALSTQLVMFSFP